MWTLMNLLIRNFLNKMLNTHLHLKVLSKPYWSQQGALPFLSSGFGANPRDTRQTFPLPQRTGLRSSCHPHSLRFRMLTIPLCSYAGSTSPEPTSLVMKPYYNGLTLLTSYSQQSDKELSLPYVRVSSVTISGPPTSLKLVLDKETLTTLTISSHL